MNELTHQELEAFCKQFSMILKAGISSLEGISLLLDDAENEEEKQLLTVMYDEMLTSGQLYLAMEKTSRFPTYMLRMVQIGEETGYLDNVLESLGTHYDREHSIAQSIKNAVFYPMVMISMIFFIIILLLTKVMPVFQQVFSQLGHEMTGISGGVLKLGNFLSDHSAVWICLLLLLFAGLFVISRNFSRFLPRSLQSSMNTCHLAESMALALRSGMMAEQGLEYAKSIISTPDYLTRIDLCGQKLSDGQTLSSALTESGLFSDTASRMVAIADKTGTLDNAMIEIAEQYNEDIHDKLTGFIASLEPTLVIILSVIVGIILLSVMLPLVGIMAAL